MTTALQRVSAELAQLAPSALACVAEARSNVALVGTQAYLTHLLPGAQTPTSFVAPTPVIGKFV